MSGLRAGSDLLALLLPPLEEAVAHAVAASGIPDPFVIEVRLRRDEFPPFIRVGSEGFRKRMTSVSAEREGAVESLYEATPPDGITMNLADYLDEGALALCRELNAAADGGFDDPDRRRASEISEEIGRELARRLNSRDWPGASEPFLVLVRIGPHYHDADPYALAAAAIGDKRVQAFRESIAARAELVRSEDVAGLDRQSLERLFEKRGLGEFSAHIAEAAERGFRLVATSEGTRSRLGGAALLPAGEAWPHARGDRPLSFLGAVDLSELPSDTPLPDAGWMLFYADIDNDDALGLIEPATNEPDSPGRFFYVEAEPVAADPPPATPTLKERRVRLTGQLTLPDDYEVADRLGLDPAAGSVYEEVANQLRYGGEGWGSGTDHWVLGAATGAQGHPNEEGTLLLFHISFDHELDFEFLDGGVIQFRIPEQALAARDWSAVTIEPDSG